MDKPKILYVTHEIDINGASKSLISIIDKFKDKYDIHVLVRGEGQFSELLQTKKCKIIIKRYYLDVEPIFSDNFADKLKWLIRVVRYKFFRAPRNRKILEEMIQYVKKNRISLVHTNSSSTFMGVKIAKESGIPHVWHFREFLKEDFNLYPLVGWETFYKIASSSERIICVSHSVMNKYKALIDTDMRCIYNGIEDDITIAKKEAHPGVNLLQVGTLSRGKGTDIAVKAVRILHEMGNADVHLYLAGRGDLSFCKKDYNAVSKYIHILGYVTNLEEVREKEKIDIELVCSKAEAFGRGIIEAMANGNPIIGSDTAGAKELIRDGETGYLYNQGDARDLASKIEILIRKPELIQRMGQNGRETFMQHFQISTCVQKIESVYKELLD